MKNPPILSIIFCPFAYLSLSHSLSVSWNPMHDQEVATQIYVMQTSNNLVTWFRQTKGTPVYIQGIKAGDSHFELCTQAQYGNPFTITPLNLDLALPTIINPFRQTGLNSEALFLSGGEGIL